jgi:histidinol-phosphate aminotransferase
MARKLKVRIRGTVAGLESGFVAHEGREGKLRLDYNENTIGCSPAVRRALARMTAEQISMYPEYGVATKRLARHFGVRPREIVLANGADDSLRVIMDVFLERGSSVLLVEPGFPMFRFYAALAGAKISRVRIGEDMKFPMKAALQELKARPTVFFLANPNNPTGTVIGKRELRQIIQASPQTAVVVDEAYAEFSGLTVLPWIRKYPNLIVVRTFSKGMGLAGLRLGFIFAKAELAEFCRKTLPPFPVNLAVLVAAEAALGDEQFVRRYVAAVKQSRRLLSGWLAKRSVKVFPSATNYVYADFGASATKIVRQLEKQGILLRDRASDFGRPGFVRIALGTARQTRRLIRALESEGVGHGKLGGSEVLKRISKGESWSDGTRPPE